MPKRIRGMLVVLHGMRAAQRTMTEEGRNDEAAMAAEIIASWERLLESVEQGRRQQVHGSVVPGMRRRAA